MIEDHNAFFIKRQISTENEKLQKSKNQKKEQKIYHICQASYIFYPFYYKKKEIKEGPTFPNPETTNPKNMNVRPQTHH